MRDLVERLRLDAIPCACARQSRLMPRNIPGEALAPSGGGGGGGGGGSRERVGELTRRMSVTVEEHAEERGALGPGRIISMVTLLGLGLGLGLLTVRVRGS